MKRKTKAQRETEAQKALSLRVHDIFAGAWGREITSDDFCTADDLSLVLPALKGRFPKAREYIWGDHNIGNFNDPAKAANFLYAHGVRA